MDADRMLKEIGEEVQNVSNLLNEIENSLKKVSNELHITEKLPDEEYIAQINHVNELLWESKIYNRKREALEEILDYLHSFQYGIVAIQDLKENL